MDTHHRAEGDSPERPTSPSAAGVRASTSTNHATGVPDLLARGVAASTLAALVLAPDGTIRYANDAARRLLVDGTSAAVPDRLPVPDRALADLLVRGEGSVAGLETMLLRGDGGSVPVTLFGSSAGGPAPGESALVFLVDRSRPGDGPAAIAHTDPGTIPAWVQGDEPLARFDAVLHSSPIALVLLDGEFKVRVWNPAAERLFGWSAAEVVGAHAPFVPPDLKPQNEELRRRALVGLEGVSGLETRRRRKDGTEVVVATYSTPIRAPDGEMAGVVIGYIDLRERKRLEAELVQAQQMESVGRLAGGVAHEFNNILTAILGYADIAHAMADGDELRSVLETVKSAAQRAGGLTRQLLAFSRRQMLRPQVLDTGDLVRDLEPALRRLIGDDVELELDTSHPAGPIVVDRAQLEQVILNLAVNARDAMPDGGRLSIRVGPAVIDPFVVRGDVPPGDYALISITDTGIGMDAVTQAHIFEPFFTTKELGRGTGLGLSTTYGTVGQSGGFIRVASEPGRGSTFGLYFPIADAAISG